jgi:hypothetical protein
VELVLGGDAGPELPTTFGFGVEFGPEQFRTFALQDAIDAAQ